MKRLVSFRKGLRCSPVALVLCAVVMLPGCPGCDPPPPLPVDSFEFDGLERAVYLREPAGHDGATPLPLLIALHGKDQSINDFRTMTGFDDLADRTGVLVAYPVAYKGAWNDGRVVPSQPSYAEGVDDVAFLVEVVARVATNFSIDTARIYACGFSNGGIMVQRLGFEETGLFAALGAVASAIPVDLPVVYTPNAFVPIMMINGTEDPILAWEGGLLFPRDPQGAIFSVPDSVGYWAELNTCAPDPAVEQLPNRETFDRTTVFKYTYEPCAGGTRVVFYQVNRGGHAWPGGPSAILFNDGPTSQDFSATDAFWEFFSGFTRP